MRKSLQEARLLHLFVGDYLIKSNLKWDHSLRYRICNKWARDYFHKSVYLICINQNGYNLFCNSGPFILLIRIEDWVNLIYAYVYTDTYIIHNVIFMYALLLYYICIYVILRIEKSTTGCCTCTCHSFVSYHEASK